MSEKKMKAIDDFEAISDGLDLDEILKEESVKNGELWRFYGRDPLVEAGFRKSDTPLWILTTIRMGAPPALPPGFEYSEGVEPVIVIDTEKKADRLIVDVERDDQG